jgi:inorganic phosphate transporter, PiT family
MTWLALIYSKEKDNPGSSSQPHPTVMRWLHIMSSASVSFSHGSNDGQKTMGIITLILATHFTMYKDTQEVPLWVIASAALAIGLGTVIGGWRVIRTVGTKISRERLSHSQGFGASMSTALIILGASHFGWPISTTHTLSSAVAGGTIPVYGADKINTKTLNLIVLAWVLTLPVAAFLAAVSYWILKLLWHG